MKRRGFLAALPAAWVAWRQRGTIPASDVAATAEVAASGFLQQGVMTANTTATGTVTYSGHWKVSIGTMADSSVTVTRVGD